jgi:glycosyltransferase involved in cell wall biosynthesis
MTICLVIIGNGRLDYLHKTVAAADQYLPPVDYRIMIDDSGDPTVAAHLNCFFPTFAHIHHPENRGMAVAVNTGFQAAFHTGADYVIWLEEDMVIQSALPIQEAIDVLVQFPKVAQILFQRQPLTPQEVEAGTVVGAMAPTNCGYWSTQTHIFSLNPCVIPRHIVELGWPDGNEREQTDRLLADGWKFGVWHGQLVEHIGESRAAAWQL